MADDAPFDLQTWHAANVGLHGDDPRLAALLFPFRPLAAAVADLRWQDPHTHAYVSDCAIYALAYLRARGVQHPALARDYRPGEGPFLIQQIARDLGAWASAEELLEYPQPGDLVCVSPPWHVECVMGSDGPTGALLTTAGGSGDGRAIAAHRHPVTTAGGQLWLSDPAWAGPRAIVGRVVAARLPVVVG